MSAGSLIGPLSISGSNTGTGAPNAGGSFFAYIVGTTTQTPIYSDPAATISVTQPVTLDNAGRIPYATYPNGLYCAGPIRLYILAADGSTVISDTTYQTAATGMALSNAKFPNELTVDAGFTAIGNSVGGIDGKYQAPSGNTPRTLQAVISSIQITPQDYGALGNGVHDDTSAIQSAVNFAISNGGGVVYLAPGTYKITSLVTATSAAGVSICGAGPNSTTISQTVGTDALTFATSSSGCSIKDIQILGSVAWVAAAQAYVSRATVTSSGATGMAFSGSSSNAKIENSFITGATNGLSMTNLAGASISHCQVVAAGANAFVFDGTTSKIYISDVQPLAAKGIVFSAGLTGTGFVVVDSPNFGTVAATAFDTSALATDPGVIQRGNVYDNDIRTIAAPATVIPRLIAAATTLNVTSGGGNTVTVSPPTPFAGANSTMELRFINNGGGAITWSLPSGYSLTAGIPASNLARTTVGFWYDVGATLWREKYRAQL